MRLSQIKGDEHYTIYLHKTQASPQKVEVGSMTHFGFDPKRIKTLQEAEELLERM